MNFEKKIISQYAKRYRQFGSSPKGSYWVSKKRQYKRFEIILKEIDKLSSGFSLIKLSDIGCGYGALVDYLISIEKINKYYYEGYDITPELVIECNKRFKHDNVTFFLGKKPISNSMFTIMSGTYNLAMTSDISSWEKYVFECLHDCWQSTSCAMVFNLQVSNKTKISSGNIYFAETSQIIDKCVSKFGPTKIIHSPDLPDDITFTIINPKFLNK